MSIYNITFSPTGGTKRVADILANELSSEFFEIDTTDRTTDFSVYNFTKDDVCIISMPSYSGRVPKVAVERLLQMHGNGASAVIVAVYGNRDYEDTLIELRDTAIQAGFTIVAGVAAIAEHSIIREFAANRPDKEDKIELQSFMKTIIEKIHAGVVQQPSIPGKYPYKEGSARPLIPYVTENCTKCGMCSFACPTGAITVENTDTVDSSKCIFCMRCISLCPHEARKIDFDGYEALRERIRPICEVRKNNELFI